MPLPANRVWLLLAGSITLQLVILRSVRVLKHDHYFQHRDLLKRTSPATPTSLLQLPYGEWYDSTSPSLRPLLVAGLLLWLGFLFSFIGISASDFFCPNLSTIAQYLGLNESTAGVTFLAFGNGSPDVFSTFSALKGGTFGLAVGELIGAASFIVSIVVGTIAFIRPFHVPRHAFLRDVLFFTAAVIVLITVLHDGHLRLFESGGMVVLYVLYVLTVVVGNWWSRRRRREGKKDILGSGRSALQAVNGERPPSIRLPSSSLESAEDDTLIEPSSVRSTSPPPLDGSPSLRPALGRQRSHTLGSHLPVVEEIDYPVDSPRATFSLLGAVEFRDVVNSLRRDHEGVSPAVGRSPLSQDRTDYFGPVTALGHRRSASHGPQRPGSIDTSGKRPRSSSQIKYSPAGPSRLGRLSPHTRSRLAADSPDPPSPNAIADSPRSRYEANPWADQLGHPPTPQTDSRDQSPSPPKPPRPRLNIPNDGPQKSVPSISIIDPAGLQSSPPQTALRTTASPLSFHHIRNESRFQVRRHIRRALRTLFPSLHHLPQKSYLGIFLGVTCVPAILALTLTLPVVDDGLQNEGAIALPTNEDEPLQDPEAGLEEQDDGSDHRLSPHIGEELHHLVEAGFSPLRSPMAHFRHASMMRTSGLHSEQGSPVEGSLDGGVDPDDTKEALEEVLEEDLLGFSKSLTAVQCVLGPLFCSFIVFRETELLPWVLLGSSIAGLITGGFVMYLAEDGSAQPWRLVRCFAGFVCSMVWIAAIADEVVSILKALGEILGLSDAIIGLTIFAVGNSLADLVADVTVAQFAPAMAYAACFGGPMLNLLLGIGGSGTYHMLTQPESAVTLNFSPTLWVSATGLVLMLVATAIFVPLNGYLIDRRWAACLVVAYTVVMCVNVGVEVRSGRA